MVALFDTVSAPGAGLSDFAGAGTARPKHSGIDDDAIAGEGAGPQGYDGILVGGAGVQADHAAAAHPAVSAVLFPADHDDRYAAGDPWWEQVIIIPRQFQLGLLLSTFSSDVELYNSDRYAARSLTAFTNTAGDGVSLTDLPSLPSVINSQRSLIVTLQVTTDGPSSVDSTIDFTFDVGGTILVPISYSTIVLWGIAPEAGYVETLEFLTEVMVKKAGGEQRIAKRKNPRQFFDFVFRMLDDGVERAMYENLLFQHQSKTFGLPIWHEQSKLTAAAAVNDTTISVGSTAYADYRVGSLAVILTSQGVFDVLTVDSIGASSLTFSSPVQNNHAVGTLVMPLRTAVTTNLLTSSRPPVGIVDLQMGFRVLDNDSDLADASAFGSYSGKVLVEDPQGLVGSSPESLEREAVVVDPGFGLSYQASAWDRGRRGRQLMLMGNGKQRLWEIRGLLHSLKGRTTAFYLPTSVMDMAPDAVLANGSANLDIVNIGYTANVQARQPKTVIRVTLVDGTEYIRTVSGSVVIDADTERLTLGGTWPAEHQIDEVERIEYVELVRIDSDSVKIEHAPGFRFKRVTMPVKSLPVS